MVEKFAVFAFQKPSAMVWNFVFIRKIILVFHFLLWTENGVAFVFPIVSPTIYYAFLFFVSICGTCHPSSTVFCFIFLTQFLPIAYIQTIFVVSRSICTEHCLYKYLYCSLNELFRNRCFPSCYCFSFTIWIPVYFYYPWVSRCKYSLKFYRWDFGHEPVPDSPKSSYSIRDCQFCWPFLICE